MKRPYYVHTPRNIYGDSLVHRCNDVCYEVRATHTGDHVYSKIKDRTTADNEVKRLNDMHEAEIESTKSVEPVYPRSVTAFIQKWQPEADARRKAFWKEFRKAANAYADNKKNDERTRNGELERDQLKTALQEIVYGRHGAFVRAKNLLEKVENNVVPSVDLDNLVSGLADIRVELDSAIKQVDENEILGFEHESWEHLVAAKDAVGMALLSIQSSKPANH